MGSRILSPHLRGDDVAVEEAQKLHARKATLRV